MFNNLDEVHQILDDLAARINRRGQVLTKEKSSTYDDNLKLSEWEREQAYCWIHATDLYLPLMVRSKEDFVHQIDMDENGDLIHQKVRILKPAISSVQYGDLTVDSFPPDLLSDKAVLWYDDWFKQASDMQRTDIIKYPEPEENVHEYLHCLSRLALKKHSSKWRESLGSFVYFLRHQVPIDERQKINELFPEHMKISKYSITRLTPNSAQPIDIKMAAEVIQGLVTRTKGRPNARKTAAQALGMVWLCLSCAFAKVNPKEIVIHRMTTTNLICKEGSMEYIKTPLLTQATSPSIPNQAHASENICNHDYKHYFLSVVSSNGDAEIPISSFLYNYLMSLPKLSNHPSKRSQLFSSDITSLRRALTAVTENNRFLSGKITFLTLLSKPHESIGLRYQS